MKKLVLVAVALSATIGFSIESRAASLTGSLSAWESAMGTWSETTTYGTVGSSITSFNTPETSVSVNEVVRQIPSGGWATWCCSYTGQVLADYSSLSVTYSLGSAVSGFGLFVEPDPFGQFNISMVVVDQILTQLVEGDSGALFFGWIGSGVTSFTLSSSVDFAAGDVFSSAASATPLPAALPLFAGGLGVLGFIAGRRKRKNATALAAA